MKSRSVWPQKPQDPIIRARVTTGITGFPRLHFISGVLIRWHHLWVLRRSRSAKLESLQLGALIMT